jgi:hypothetical protein
LVLTAGLLLGGCDNRPDAQVTPTSSTPRAKASGPAKMVQKPQTELARIFNAAGTVLLSLKTPEELARIKPRKAVSVSSQPNGLKITVAGPDRSVFLPEFRGEGVILKFAIDSQVDTTLVLFYLLPGQKTYTSAQNLKQRVTAGKNVIYVELAPGWTGRLRLDPGIESGEYVLESVEAKAVSADGTR